VSVRTEFYSLASPLGLNSDVTSLGVLDVLLLVGVMSMDVVRRIPSKVTGMMVWVGQRCLFSGFTSLADSCKADPS
jgi:hypothetical protein